VQYKKCHDNITYNIILSKLVMHYRKNQQEFSNTAEKVIHVYANDGIQITNSSETSVLHTKTLAQNV